MRLTEKVPIITARAVPVTTARMTIMKRILVASEYKKSGNRCYKLY